MADRTFALTMRKSGDAVVLERDGKGQVVRPQGGTLEITGPQAVAWGLAEAEVDSIAALAKRLGLTACDEAWPAKGPLSHRELCLLLRNGSAQLVSPGAQSRSKEKQVQESFQKLCVGRQLAVELRLEELRYEVPIPTQIRWYGVSLLPVEGRSRRGKVACLDLNHSLVFAAAACDGQVRVVGAAAPPLAAQFANAPADSVSCSGKILGVRVLRLVNEYAKGDYYWLQIVLGQSVFDPGKRTPVLPSGRQSVRDMLLPVMATSAARRLRNARHALEEDETGAGAKPILRSVVKHYPGTESAKQAKTLLQELE